MRAFYEQNKKLAITLFTVICIAIVFVTGVAAYHIADAGKEENVAVSEPYRYKEAVQEKTTEKPKKTEVSDTELIEETSAPQPAQEVEIVEDSKLDVVETPKPKEEKPVEVKAEPDAAPLGVDLSNMNHNAEFPYEIHVNKKMNCVTVYAMDNNGLYSIPYKAFVCSTGNATPLGTFQTPAKYIWKVLKGNVWGQYSTRVAGGILFHSVPYRTNRKDALISKYYNKLGQTASAGCIRLTTIDAKWIYDNCPLGTTVIIYNDDNPGPLGKPTAMKVPENNGWDPTDPDPANPWIGRILRINGVRAMEIERGAGFDAMGGITATDASGNDVTGSINISTDVDVSRVGIYAVHYRVSDSSGNSVGEDAAVTVVDTQAPVINGVPSRVEGKKASDINRDLLLNGISLTDNGYGLGLDHVEVNIPALVDGDNQVTYRAWDDYGNQTSTTTTVVCDLTAPVISKAANIPSIVETDWQPSDSNIRGRINVSDKSPTSVSYTTENNDWGYTFKYTVSDSYGNTSYFTDKVTYIDYEITGDKFIYINEGGSLQDMTEGIQLKDSTGKVTSIPSDAKISTLQMSEDTYQISVEYTYSSKLGSKTCSFNRMVYIK